MSKDEGEKRIKNSAWRIRTVFHRTVHYPIDELDHYSEQEKQFVYKIKGPPKDMKYYRKRILELSDGCSVNELLQRLYCEEKNHGGAVAYIGLVESAWKEEMAREVDQLIEDGYLYCEDRKILSIHNEVASNRKEWIRAHRRVYRKLSKADKLSERINNGNTHDKTDAFRVLHLLTDVRVLLNNGNNAFTGKESKDTQKKVAEIHNDFITYGSSPRD